MKRILSLLCSLSIVCFFILTACVTAPVQKKPEQLTVVYSLPQSKLTYYNDSFDRLREDIWEKGAVTYKSDQEANFKAADINIKDGQLVIKTKTGSFSNASLTSKYLLRGDFDVQLDCNFVFLDGQYDMDQHFLFGVYDSKLQWDKSHSYVFLITKWGGQDSGRIISAYREGGKRHPGSREKINNFHGTLRMVRTGNNISTLYKKVVMTEWKKMDTFRSTKNDLSVILYLGNYNVIRTSISAKKSITARFDNFRINAAQDIIEEDI